MNWTGKPISPAYLSPYDNFFYLCMYLLHMIIFLLMYVFQYEQLFYPKSDMWGLQGYKLRLHQNRSTVHNSYIYSNWQFRPHLNPGHHLTPKTKPSSTDLTYIKPYKPRTLNPLITPPSRLARENRQEGKLMKTKKPTKLWCSEAAWHTTISTPVIS